MRRHGTAPPAPPAVSGAQATPGVQPASGRIADAKTPAQVAANASLRAEELRGYRETLNAELARLKEEMLAHPLGSPARMRYRQRAKQVMRQKKNMEKRMENALNLSYNMTVAEDIQASQRDALMFQSLRGELGMTHGHSATGDQYSMNELGEIIQQSDELAAILGAPLEYDLDDTELEDELAKELDGPQGGSHLASNASKSSRGRH
jgi:hypothetical protein